MAAIPLSTNDRVAVSLDDDGVAQVRLTRPDKMNALDRAMFDGIISAAESLDKMRGLRAVVLSGEGRAFSAGLDTASFANMADPDEPPLEERTYGIANRFQQVATAWRELAVPVVAAIHGVCFGGGLQIASGADVRIARADARLAIMEMRWGIVPDMGGYRHWRGLVRDDVLRELVYTNREISGEEAQVMGLVTEIADDPLARALDLAGTIAMRNPHAIRAAKRLSNAMADTDGAALLLRESEEQAAIIRSSNQVEAVLAGMAKRIPVFSDV
ncbi:crotonase/enoyl-CoA hydratase family protein [Erythrobacter sp. 3-20A1M]|uniref:crotonase/enoyl-CoA hydratase family protein n=1 Tax=Erythrobacter sp. 3-20A1M TaxID=2653850 RepID=UPI001BFC09CE|nr:crotonase/enoyl-CoA hydratase family protein [Erythrobacter sp. 3-20A1M]QWC57132.1 crotonase/enoyl-CoA hydratase family protein [Erythrobacter sp. 3-20A1M]